MSPSNQLWILFRSILIILSVSSTISCGFGIIFHSWIAGMVSFIMATIAQFAINAMIQTIAATKNKKAEFLAMQVLQEASQRRLPYILNCAYCNAKNQAGISFINENIFECIECKQANKVYIQFTTVRITTPLTQKENTSTFIDMDEEAGASQSTINMPIIMNEK